MVSESRNRGIVENGTAVLHHRNGGSESPGILTMTNVERVERDIAREKMFREAFMNGKEPTDEDRAAWALADAHNQMSLDYARQLDAKEAVTNIKISSEVKIKK